MAEGETAAEEPKAEPRTTESAAEPNGLSAVETSFMDTTTAEAVAPAPTFPPVDLSTKWEIAAITFYASCFHKLWHLPHVYAEDIEDGCSALCEDLAGQFFLDFLVALLQSFRKCVEINRDNYQVYLFRIAQEAGKAEMLSRFAEQSFWVLPTLSRIELLMALCLARIDLDVNNPEGKLKDVDADTLRMQPLGDDSKGQIYWYFGDTRLCRDVPPPPSPPSPKKKNTPKAKPRRRTGGRSRRGKRKRSVSPKKGDKSVDKADNSALDVSANDTSVVEEKQPDPPTARWEIVCSTEEQWHTFFAELSTSQKPEDIALCEVISENIMPNLQELFAEKERMMKKRALMMAPRRQSYRLEEKRKAFVEAHRFISYIASDGELVDNGNDLERMNGTSVTIIEDEQSTADDGGTPDHPKRKFRRPPMTNEEALERKRRQQEELEKMRQQAASARANRANRRAEGLPASGLDDETGQMFEDYEEEEDDEEMDYFRMEEIMLALTKHQDAPPFVEPVSTSIAPDYYDIIKRPMDLGAMSVKLMQHQYSNIEELVSDFEQICQNCITYNGVNNAYSTRIRRLSRFFQTQLRQNFPQAAKDRIDRGYIGQMQQQQHQQPLPAINHHQYSRQIVEDFDTSATGDTTTSMSSPDVSHAWNGGRDDPDWSPRHNRGDKPPKPRRRKNNVDYSMLSSPDLPSTSQDHQEYSQFCNNLDQLLGSEVDNQIVSSAVHEMVSIRAKGSPKKRRVSVPLQPKPTDFLTGYQQPPPPQPRPKAQRSPRQPSSQPKPRQTMTVLPNSASSTMPHNYHQPGLPPNFNSPTNMPQTATVLRQTPTGLTSLPGAYFRPTIGELPPPIRRVSTSNTPVSANGLRNLLLNPSTPITTTAVSHNVATPPNSAPKICIKLVGAAKPTVVQQQQQRTVFQQPQSQVVQQPGAVAYVVPITLAKGTTAGNATVFVVQPHSGQQISLNRVQQPAAQPTPPPLQQTLSTSSVANHAPVATSTPSTSNGGGGGGNSGTGQQTQTFSTAFLNFVNSSSARV